jgi:hypothetical protein
MDLCLQPRRVEKKTKSTEEETEGGGWPRLYSFLILSVVLSALALLPGCLPDQRLPA